MENSVEARSNHNDPSDKGRTTFLLLQSFVRFLQIPMHLSLQQMVQHKSQIAWKFLEKQYHQSREPEDRTELAESCGIQRCCRLSFQGFRRSSQRSMNPAHEFSRDK